MPIGDAALTGAALAVALGAVEAVKTMARRRNGKADGGLTEPEHDSVMRIPVASVISQTFVQLQSMTTTLSLMAKDHEKIAESIERGAALQGETLRAVVALGEREKERARR